MKTTIVIKKQKGMKNVYCQGFMAYLFFFILCNPSFPFLGLNLAPKISKHFK